MLSSLAARAARPDAPANFDYMLLSPSVCVFRDGGGSLLDEPYPVSVFSVPAPNKRGNYSALCVGMLNRGSEHNVENILQYAQWMEGSGIVDFPTAERTVAVLYATDRNGTDLATVSLRPIARHTIL